ncbi:MAG: DUF309 domain-containing protein [Chlorobiales bacterium]|jgi:hypothetical protein|nr:DUF309 domain-containing protein [Chlorobiales bacterium]
MNIDDHYEAFLKGVEEYNKEFFYESHDTWEEIWHEVRGPDRLFLQGLIHLAVGLFHFSNRNWKGARSQLQKCLKKLEPYEPAYLGLNTSELRRHIQETLFPLIDRMEQGEPLKTDGTIYPKLSIEKRAPKHDAPEDAFAKLDRLRVDLLEEIGKLNSELSTERERTARLKADYDAKIKEISEQHHRHFKRLYAVLGLFALAIAYLYIVTK